MINKHSKIKNSFTFLLIVFFCLPSFGQQQPIDSIRYSLGKVNKPDDINALDKRFFNGLNAGDQFGQSVSSAGDVNGDGYDDLIVGAPNYDNGASTDAGRAYIYFGGTIINNTPDVILTGEATSNYFGSSVSTAGDVNGDGYSDVIVGAYGNNGNTGKSYVYFGGSTMNNIADVTMTGEAVGNYFGGSVSTAGDVNRDGYSDVIVGAYGNNGNTGKSYVYFGGSTMNNIADLTMTGEAVGNFFGGSVSTAGDVNGDGFSDVIVGASFNNSSTGKSHIYFGGSTMNNIADVSMTGEAAGNLFGTSVFTAGDVNGDGYSDVIVGASFNNSSTGKSYIYFGGSAMNNIADVTMTGETAGNLFGFSVSTAGDVNGDGYSDVIVGAYANNSWTGKSYIYFGGSAMNNIADVTMTGEAAGDYFGSSVSTAGDVNGDGFSDILVGAYRYNVNGNNSGRAYLFENSLTGNDIADDFFTGEATGNRFSYSVSTAGDLNGDGYDDFIVGAYGYNSNTGRAYIYYGGTTPNNTAIVVLTGEATNNYFGASVSSAGDVNGDGYGDVIVGAYGNNSSTGKSYIYFGGPTMNNTADVTMTGEATNNYFGASVSSAGDVNGDGYGDVIVGAYGNNSSRGKSYIYFGGSTMNNTADITMSGEAASSLLGYSVSTAGDVNGDGYSDVIVGAYVNNIGTGKSYIYFGGSSMNNTPDIIMTGEAVNNNFGISVSTAGDVNGDGYSDVIVGAPGNNDIGKSYIYFGGSPMDNLADVTMAGEAAENYFGVSTSTAGDVNGDGYSDVIVGAQYINSHTGKSYIYFGGSTMNNTPDITMTGEATNNYFGYSVSTAGDVNGDGYSDVIVGAYGNNISTGKNYLFLSSSPAIKPRIASIKDIAFDQGGNVNVYFVRSGYDAKGPNNIITEYLVEMSNPPAISGFSWAQLGTVQPVQNLLYTFNAQTPNDSATNNSGTYFFRVTARTEDPNQYWRSNILSGHSADNIAPFAVSGFTANSVVSNTALHWHPNSDIDLYNYVLFRSSSPTIDPNVQTPISTVTDTLFTDINPPAGEVYYFILAQDIHNNFSPLSIAGGGDFVGVEIRIYLEGAYSGGSLSQSLTLPTISPYNINDIASSIPIGAVDWVFLELRDKNNSSSVLGSVSAFVKTDGTIVNMFGGSPVYIPVTSPISDKYFVVVKHRNHLGIMSATAINVINN